MLAAHDNSFRAWTGRQLTAGPHVYSVKAAAVLILPCSVCALGKFSADTLNLLLRARASVLINIDFPHM